MQTKTHNNHYRIYIRILLCLALVFLFLIAMTGFAAAEMRGSENNDPFLMENGRVITKTNNCGGILGGITNAMPLTFRVAVKPTPSIAREQITLNTKTQQAEPLVIGGRHDPCIVPRAVPCIEAAAAIAVYDALLDRRKEQI